MSTIKELRLEKGLSMSQVSKELGMPYTTYVSYENEDREPNFKTLKLLADYFNCSVDYLIGRSNINSKETLSSQRIKSSRENIGLSQTDLAKKVGISKQTLYKYENGIITNIPIENIKNLAEVLAVSPEYLLGITDEPNVKDNVSTEIDKDVVLQIQKTLNDFDERLMAVEEKLSGYNDDILGVYRNMGVINAEFYELTRKFKKLIKGTKSFVSERDFINE